MKVRAFITEGNFCRCWELGGLKVEIYFSIGIHTLYMFVRSPPSLAVFLFPAAVSIRLPSIHCHCTSLTVAVSLSVSVFVQSFTRFGLQLLDQTILRYQTHPLVLFLACNTLPPLFAAHSDESLSIFVVLGLYLTIICFHNCAILLFLTFLC